jgi:molybdenum-dependent DNA-binding transcriptional regulator ModE
MRRESGSFLSRLVFRIRYSREDTVSARIQFQQVRYFLALATEGNFTRAAKRCGVSQPSLTNAIKSLELTLGGRLFERSLNGCGLTELGAKLRPHFERLQSGVEQVGRIAGNFPATTSVSSGKGQSLTGRALTLGAAVLLACLTIGNPGAAQAGGHNVEAAIAQVLPVPRRCGRTAEPLFTCRHESPPEHSMILDLSFGRDGPSASLTYNYDDARHHQLLAVMCRFFGAVGVSAGAYDACIAESEWQPLPISTRNSRLLCFRVELGDRVTYEVFATASDEIPALAGAGR